MFVGVASSIAKTTFSGVTAREHPKSQMPLFSRDEQL
jgi:hypothetical protein